MQYYFYNTDAEWIIGPPRYHKLIEGSFAAVGGDMKKYGEQFRILKQNDVLLMYQNKVGVVAIGRVLESWDGEQYTQSLYYTSEETETFGGNPYEYRIKVNWFLDLSNEPITHKYLKKRLNITPRGAIGRYPNNQDKIEEMLSELFISKFHELIRGNISGRITIDLLQYRIITKLTLF